MEADFHSPFVVENRSGAAACTDPPPVGVGAVQRGLDQRRVGDRARDQLDRVLVAAAHDAPGRSAARPRRRRPSAPRARAEARRAPRRSAARPRSRARRHAARARGDQHRGVVGRELTVDGARGRTSACTALPSSRSARPGASTASVCTKHSIVAKRGEIMPAPLHCARAPDLARGQRKLEVRVLGEGVCGLDRKLEVAGAIGAQLADLAARIPRSNPPRPAGSAPIPPVDATATWPPCTPAATAAAPCVWRRLPARDRPWPAFAQPELTSTARSPDSRQRSRLSCTGAPAAVELAVKRAALTGADDVATPAARDRSPRSA